MKEFVIEAETLARKLAGLRKNPRAEYETEVSFDPKDYKLRCPGPFVVV